MNGLLDEHCDVFRTLFGPPVTCNDVLEERWRLWLWGELMEHRDIAWALEHGHARIHAGTVYATLVQVLEAPHGKRRVARGRALLDLLRPTGNVELGELFLRFWVPEWTTETGLEAPYAQET